MKLELEELEQLLEAAREFCYSHQAQVDCRFIAASREFIPKLIAVAKAARVACADHDLQCEDANQSLERLSLALEELERGLG